MKTASSTTDPIASLVAQMHAMEVRKPFLKEILEAFGGIVIAGAGERARLAALPAPVIPTPDLDRLSAGVPLLSGMELSETPAGLSACVKRMLNALEGAFPPVARDVGRLRSRAEEDPECPAVWLGLLIQNDERALTESAKDLGLEPETFRFALEQALKPFLQHLARTLGPHVERIRWDRGYCPVCGAYPDASCLRKTDERQEYLTAHGGERWLHCALCSHEWRLHRVVCPCCGNEDGHMMEYFAAEDLPHERVYACHRCKKYLPCMDTSELIEAPPGDLLPFELLHLDIVAQKRGFTPLAWHHWSHVPSG